MEAGQNFSSPAVNEAVAVKPQNFFSRLLGVYFSPGETFAEIGRAPRVLIPTLLFMLLAVVGSHFLVERYGRERIIRESMESMVSAGWLPQERADEAIKLSTTPAAIRRGRIQGIVTGAGMGLLMLLVTAGLFKLFSLLMGAENTFKQLLSVAAYAFLAVGLLSTAVLLLTVFLKDPAELDMTNPVSSNLGALLTMAGAGLPKFVIGLAAYIDVFTIWRLILLSIGFAAVSRRLKAGTAGIFLGLLLAVGAFLGAGMTSFFQR
jgi:hypothetical protein